MGIEKLVEQMKGLSFVDSADFFDKLGDHYTLTAKQYSDKDNNDLAGKLYAVASSLCSVSAKFYSAHKIARSEPRAFDEALFSQVCGLTFSDASDLFDALGNSYSSNVRGYSLKGDGQMLSYLRYVVEKLFIVSKTFSCVQNTIESTPVKEI